ncbi:MAG TPA: aromatic ring-hydroxylating dioxygenase subunit alpha [Nocardioidaceae bacterium]|nr:aromatic ring-hydroxylating dioxygenase subunit alpha [Nocardioidaceae bacterium]
MARTHDVETVDGATGSTSLQPVLPAEMYVDHQAWLRERERVLFRSWFCVGRLRELGLHQPNQLAVVDLAGESVLVTTDETGGLHAAYNVCRHRGSQIVPVDPSRPTPSPCATQALRCPYHSWTYGMDGHLLKAPHTDELDDFDPGSFGLNMVGVGSWGGFCFVHLSPDEAVPLASEVAEFDDRLRRYPLDTLVRGRSYVYDVAANYKVLAENYNECYHCGPVHPELCRLVPTFAGGGKDLDWEDGVPHREGAWTFTLSGTSKRRPFPDLDAHERKRHKGELVYPNLLLSCSADHVAATVLWPVSESRTRVVCDLLFDAEETQRPDFDADDAGELWDLVNRQDWAICESVQRGMSSRGYRQGWFAPMEEPSADIRRWLLPRLGAGNDDD